MTLPEHPQPGPAGKDPAQPSAAQLAEGYAAKAGLHRSSNGNIDVLKSAGGCPGHRREHPAGPGLPHRLHAHA